MKNKVIKGLTISGTQHEIDAKYWGGKEESSKQDKLVSGNNIKTINGESILGAGNINLNFLGGDPVGLYTTTT